MSAHVYLAGSLRDGREVSVIELANAELTVRLLDLGATLWQVIPRTGTKHRGVCLYHDDPLQYADNPPYLGCTVGPVANRIGNSRFVLDGVVHDVEPNEGVNHLHGGRAGFGRRLWEYETHGEPDAVTFKLTRPDGEDGYPGNLVVEATWTLQARTLRFEWTARTDRHTPVSITNHAYWNLAGHGTVVDQWLSVGANELVEVGTELIPTGRLTNVAGTRFDLQRGRQLGQVVGEGGDGIDHCYVVGPGCEIRLSAPALGFHLDVETSLPGVQVYTGHMLSGLPADGGYPPMSGVCLETQFFPDAVNNPQFPSPVVPAGGEVHHWTNYTLDWPADVRTDNHAAL